jgi:DNA-binding XRE family transcriptional regulator
MELGGRIRKARVERGLSLSALARLAGLSKGFLSQVEAGHSSLSLISLNKLASCLQIPVSRLMDVGEPAPWHTGTATPSIIRARRVARPTTAIEPSVVFGASRAYLLTISRGQRIQGRTSVDADDPAPGCLVVAGGLSVLLDGREHELAQGEILTFAEASRYTFACSNNSATLLLILPQSCELPGVDMIAPRPGESPSAPIAGPFRLVEMRAARRAARRFVP